MANCKTGQAASSHPTQTGFVTWVGWCRDLRPVAASTCRRFLTPSTKGATSPWTTYRHRSSCQSDHVPLVSTPPGDGVGGASADVGLEAHRQTQFGHGLAGSLLGSVDGRRDLAAVVLTPHRKHGADQQLLGPKVHRAQVDDTLHGRLWANEQYTAR